MNKLFLISSVIFLMACGGANPSEERNKEKEIIPVYEFVMESKWGFESENSNISWTRFLDQKATKKKTKLFGTIVNVELGPVQLNMKGNVLLKEGSMTDQDGVPQYGAIKFDMSTFKFAQEKGQGLFSTKDFPNSILDFLSFKSMNDSTLYITDLKLTIQDHSDTINAVQVYISIADSAMNFKGKFSFNTLDFPLRENAKKKEVNKDIITVNMDLNFTLSDTFKKDSIQIN